jgi:RNA polymerase sigma-70 factor (ECF subfamily)
MEAMTDHGASAVGREGFAGFFREHYETLLRAMYLMTGDRYEAEELAQDAFVRICERWDRVSGMDNPAGYLYRTATNARKSAIRRLTFAARRAASLREIDPISDSDERDRIRRALAKLPTNQREAVVLVEWLGFSDAEAANVLGTSAGAIRVRLSRARHALSNVSDGGAT